MKVGKSNKRKVKKKNKGSKTKKKQKENQRNNNKNNNNKAKKQTLKQTISMNHESLVVSQEPFTSVSISIPHLYPISSWLYTASDSSRESSEMENKQK